MERQLRTSGASPLGRKGSTPSECLRALGKILATLSVLCVIQCGDGTEPVRPDTPSQPASASIGLSPTSLSFTATAGGSNPTSKTVDITNSGGGTLSGLSSSVSYATGSGWLTTSLSSTTAPSTLTVQPATGSLTAGTYSATISISATGATNSPRTISVTLTVSGAPAPSITLSPTGLSFTATAGGSNPTSKTVDISNGGGGTLSGLSSAVSYSTGSGWLSTSFSSTTAPSTLTVQPTTGSLSAGNYAATISISATGATNSPQTISVTLTVSAAVPLIELGLDTARFAVVWDTLTPAVPPPQTVLVLNGGGGTLSGLTADISYSGGILAPTGWLTASFDSTTAPAVLTLSPTRALTSNGYATVEIASPGAGNSPQSIRIYYSVSSRLILDEPTVTGTTIGLRWQFQWLGLVSNQDGYVLEESTTGPSSGFTQVASWTTTNSPFTTTRTRSAGTYWYRVRAKTCVTAPCRYIATSDARIAQVATPASNTRFRNNTVWPIPYLTIDGVQQFPESPWGIAPGDYLDFALTPGSHTYEARTGWWETSTSRFEIYWYSGAFTQVSGTTGTVDINNPPITDLLTRFETTGCWEGEYWSNLDMYFAGFRFNTNGTFTLYSRHWSNATKCSGTVAATGSYSLVSYEPFAVRFRVSYSGGPSYVSDLNDIYGQFYMQNGPADWRLILYTYVGP